MSNLEAMYYLSPLQEGMLFHSLYAPESGVYVEQLGCTLQGDLDIAAFERAWGRVVKRHSTFRTAFIWEGREKMVQVVQRDVDVPFEHLDWRADTPDRQQERLVLYLQEQRERGFKFSKAPLMRLALIRMAEDSYHFAWSHHHVLLDGWSLPLVLKEVFAYYEVFSRGQDVQLPPTRPYRDYIAWLQSQDLAQAERFWRKMLKGFSTPTPLGVDRAVSQPLAATHAKEEVKLPAETTAALQLLARQRKLTLNTILQGAWAILLSRYSGETDIVYGATMSGRPPELVGVETMVGLFINTLPMRVDVHDETRLVPWLQSLQARQLEIRQYEYSPLMQVQRWSEVPRGTQLFASLVVFENYPVDERLRERNTSLAIKEVHFTERTNYALTLVAAVPHSQLTLGLTYDCSRFDAATIARLLGHLLGLLERIAADPEQRVGDVSLLSAAERQQVLVEWNAGGRGVQLNAPTSNVQLNAPTSDVQSNAPTPDDQCVHQLIEAQVARTPDAVAVVFGDQQITYRALDECAGRLAGELRGLGAGPETRIAICLERSLDMLIGLLAILKAGAAYLPLDPGYPQQRLAFMLQDSQAPLLITQREMRDWRPALSVVEGLEIASPGQSPTIIYLDHGRPALAHMFSEHHTSGQVNDHANGSLAAAVGGGVQSNGAGVQSNAADRQSNGAGTQSNGVGVQLNAPTPDNLAYIIYTSGSTGKPKGVQIPHRALVNFLASMRQAPGLSVHDTLLAVTTLSFDIAALELFLPLIAGARLVLVSRDTAGDGTALLATLQACRATVMQATPVTWRLLLDAGWSGDPPLTVLCGGEALPRDLATELLQRHARVWNLYGPTETTVWSCLERVEAAHGPVPIGRPIANTAVYVLDAQYRPVPIGVPGELYIGGIGVARGYFNRPDLTAERFIPNAFGRLEIRDWRLPESESPISNLQSLISSGSRLYRTGDQARWLADGRLEFLGRIDHQVKVRGHRIELGEIEAALREHPRVREALVVARNPDARPEWERREWKGEGVGAWSGTSLVAYVATDAGQDHLIGELRRFLQEQLPTYMLPSAFVFLGELPRLPNGKINRRVLPTPSQMHPELEQGYVAPRTRTETTLAGIWSGVLGAERVGIHDNFFDLGGHSLLATQILARIRTSFQLDLPLKVLFEALTVHELAREILLYQLRSASREKIAASLQVLGRMPDHEVQSALLARERRRALAGG